MNHIIDIDTVAKDEETIVVSFGITSARKLHMVRVVKLIYYI